MRCLNTQQGGDHDNVRTTSVRVSEQGGSTGLQALQGGVDKNRAVVPHTRVQAVSRTQGDRQVGGGVVSNTSCLLGYTHKENFSAPGGLVHHHDAGATVMPLRSLRPTGDG